MHCNCYHDNITRPDAQYEGYHQDLLSGGGGYMVKDGGGLVVVGQNINICK